VASCSATPSHVKHTISEPSDSSENIPTINLFLQGSKGYLYIPTTGIYNFISWRLHGSWMVKNNIYTKCCCCYFV